MNEYDKENVQFHILEGLEEAWVEVVPSSWFDGKNCLWPPKAKSLSNYVKFGYQPDETWISTPAKIRKSFKTYEEAVKKRAKAVSSENLETSDAEQSKKSRSKRKTKTVFDPSCVIKRAKDFKRILPRVESSSDEDSPRAPTPPTLNTELIPEFVDHISSDSLSTPNRRALSSLELVTHRAKSTSTERSKNASECLNTPNRENLEEFVQRSIIKLHQGIVANEKLTAGVFSKLDLIDVKLSQREEEDPDEDQGLPISSMIDFDQINEDLKDGKKRKKLITKLGKIGGNSAGSVTRNILSRLIDKEFGKSFSWYGKKDNRALGTTLLGKAIIAAAVSCQSFPITEVIAVDACKNWLRHLKDKPVAARRL